ncbi:cation-translocating P-type ATPase [Campylobacter sp. LR196d]|uniref:heavy metal translocating P-type ATPase n=1 Tax=Campylobacter sp. LR196d TaxID=2593543 RepID=UPI00123B60DF|nr:cation-translocating P-type ATPase [Campylobacter sp. LR196d]KAA6226808.1 cation-translocating P-type ATPase [Campylobacter sp. LR196d]
MKELRLKIGKMTCTNCSNGIEKVCKKIDGVENASVSYINSSGVFLLRDENIINTIKNKIISLGYEILEDEFGLNKFKQKELKKLKFKLFLSFTLSILIMYFEMFVSGEFSALIQGILSMFVIFYCGKDFFKHAFLGVKNKNLDMNTLIVLGSLSAFLYSLMAYFGLFGENSQLYFSGGAMIISFVLLGKVIEESIKQRASTYQNNLNKINANKTLVLDKNNEFKESLSSFVNIGDEILVKEGQCVCVDGVILKGQAQIDMSFLNGEFLPVLKKENDKIEAGSILINGNLHIRASKKAMDSTLERLKDLVFKASSIKTPLTKLVDKISAYFVGSIIIIALCVFIFWLIKVNLNLALLHACATLLISCPCALGLATPIALSLAFSKGARNFILIKNPVALEVLSSIKLVLFDKTGTLTTNDLNIFKHNLSDEDFNKLAQIESQSFHPIAKAIVKKAGIKENKLLGESEVLLAKGIKYSEEGEIYISGNADFLQENYINIDKTRTFLNEFEERAPTQLYFAKNKLCLGGLCFENSIKQGAKELISYLYNKKISSIILSGDNEKSVSKIAKELGIKEFYSKLSPDDKLNFLQKCKKEVLFIGDGINDAACLSSANASMSFAKASELAQKSGDFILMKDDLRLVIFAFKLANKTKTIIKENLFWAFIYNTCCIPIAAGALPFITLSPHIAALAMCCSSITVVLNSLRLKALKF